MLAYAVASLDNGSDIIHILKFLFPGSLKTLHRFDLLVKLTFHDCQLP